MAHLSWRTEPSGEGGVFWTELGSPVGLGVADWDLEAFWQSLASEKCTQKSDLQVGVSAGEDKPQDNRRNCHVDKTASCAQRDVPSKHQWVSTDIEEYWDAGTEFEEDAIPSGAEDLPSACSCKRDDPEELSDSSMSDSEELDRWLTGSQSQTTEDSTIGSAASSTLDFAEWASTEHGAGLVHGLKSLSFGVRLGLLKRPPLEPSSPWLRAQPKVSHSKLQDGHSKGSLWTLGRLVSSGKPCLKHVEEAMQSQSGKECPVEASSQGAEASSKDGGMSEEATCLTPMRSGTTVVEGLDLGAPDCNGADSLCPSDLADGSQCPRVESRLQFYSHCFSPAAAGATGGGGKEVLDLIPDSDLDLLVETVSAQEGEMLNHQKKTHDGKASRKKEGNQDAASHAEQSAPSIDASSSSAERDCRQQAPWKLIMTKNTDVMEYSSWVRDRGSHFGGLEFRGRMLLMPKLQDKAAGGDNGRGKSEVTEKRAQGLEKNLQAGVEGDCAVVSQESRWGPEAVRDFLLDEIHRAEWDESREVSTMLEDWDENGCSTARWVRKLPLFLRSREYVVGRRVWNPASCPRTYFCISKNIDHPAAPTCKHLLRVSKFFSSWRVRPLSPEETEEKVQYLQSTLRNQGKGKMQQGNGGSEVSQTAARGNLGEGMVYGGPDSQAVEIITHYEEQSGLPKNLVHMGVAHSMWGHMLKMEQALRNYCASGRNLRHLLPVTLLQAEQQGAGTRGAAALGVSPAPLPYDHSFLLDLGATDRESAAFREDGDQFFECDCK